MSVPTNPIPFLLVALALAYVGASSLLAGLRMRDLVSRQVLLALAAFLLPSVLAIGCQFGAYILGVAWLPVAATEWINAVSMSAAGIWLVWRIGFFERQYHRGEGPDVEHLTDAVIGIHGRRRGQHVDIALAAIAADREERAARVAEVRAIRSIAIAALQGRGAEGRRDAYAP